MKDTLLSWIKRYQKSSYDMAILIHFYSTHIQCHLIEYIVYISIKIKIYRDQIMGPK